MGWKNYFYFDRRDRNAILLILVFIIISILVYICLYKQGSTSVIVQNENALAIDSIKPSKLAVGEVVNLNLSDTTMLMRVPGIGSSYANRIVKYRELLGGYVSLVQLKEVWGVDNEMFDQINSYFIVEGEPRPIRVNHSDYNTLIKHPYLNKEQVKVILDLSKRKRNLASIKRLSLLEEFSKEDIKRLEPYLSFR